ncbi:hypothetical protein FACS189454_01620 [Planctomycetales bacterium]|nr:hypothetical protein FACS189454_01620 [Planctomycetales bacterium]
MKGFFAAIGFLFIATGLFAQNFPGEPIAGYFQPVQIRCPDGTHLAGIVADQFSQQYPAPLQVGMLIGCNYRLRITDIPFHAGEELYPTVQIFSRMYPPKGRELDFPIIIDMTLEDIELALEGRYITKVVYLEDPKKALAVPSDPTALLSVDIKSGDPVAVASTQGLAVAVIRLGGRIPNDNRIDSAFAFGSPPWLLNRTIPPQQIVQATFTTDSVNSIKIDPNLKESGAKVAEQRQKISALPLDGRRSEYLADGGDSGLPTKILSDWTVRNLDAEDTAAHFDTLDNRTLVEASNKVYLYAPRFRIIRKVEGLINESQVTALVETTNRHRVVANTNREKIGFTEQETKSNYARSKDTIVGVGGRNRSGGLGNTLTLTEYSNFEVIDSDSMMLRQSVFDLRNHENLSLGKAAAKANAWAGIQGIKIQVNELAPMEQTGVDGVAAIFQIDDKQSGTSKLRLIKVASADTAQTGEVISFTLRFDNVGNQLVGNVTILDNLTGRLEFIPGSAMSSLPSGFAVQTNAGGSLTLRFEITNPLQPGDFGVVSFQCRVR